MPGTILVEGLPGSGKSTIAGHIGVDLAEQHVRVDQWPEGRTNHPVDFEGVAVLTEQRLAALAEAAPAWRLALEESAECLAGLWIVQVNRHPDLPPDLVAALRQFDVYDGDVTLDQHARVLRASWDRYGATPASEVIQVWECVLIQNPVCAFIARHDAPSAVLEHHVRHIAAAIDSHRPALVYLDAGAPEVVLRRAADERPAQWRESVIAYHTQQGYGLRRGLHGFDGYVDFMRHRREVELGIIERLVIPTLIIDTTKDDRATARAKALAFAVDHIG